MPYGFPRPHAEELFSDALALAPAEREGFPARACSDDAVMRQRVSELLEANSAAGGFMEMPAVAAPVVEPRAPVRTASEHLGRYRLLQKIGEGGCGVVYMAEQQQPVRRRVALKTIRRLRDLNTAWGKPAQAARWNRGDRKTAKPASPFLSRHDAPPTGRLRLCLSSRLSGSDRARWGRVESPMRPEIFSGMIVFVARIARWRM